jgi:SNF2 family DNA or RNA helicase
MSAIALRRTKETKMNGKKLIELPQKELRIQYVEFSHKERERFNELYEYYANLIQR